MPAPAPARGSAVWYRLRPGGPLSHVDCAGARSLALAAVLAAARAQHRLPPEAPLCARRAGGRRELLPEGASLPAGSEVLVRAVERVALRPDGDGRTFRVGTFAEGAPDFANKAEGAWHAGRTPTPETRAAATTLAQVQAQQRAQAHAGVRLSRAGGEQLQGDQETQNSHYFVLVMDDNEDAGEGGGAPGAGAAGEAGPSATAVRAGEWYSFKRVSDVRSALTTEDAEALMATRNKKSYQRWMLKNEGIRQAVKDEQEEAVEAGTAQAGGSGDTAMGFGGADKKPAGKSNKELLDELNRGDEEDKGEAWEHDGGVATDDDEAAAAGSDREPEEEEEDPLRRKRALGKDDDDEREGGEGGNKLTAAGQTYATLLARAGLDGDSDEGGEDDSDDEIFVDPDQDDDAAGLFDKIKAQSMGAGGEAGSAGDGGKRKRDDDGAGDVKRVKVEVPQPAAAGVVGAAGGSGPVTAQQLRALLRSTNGMPTKGLVKHFKPQMVSAEQKQAFRALLKAHTKVVERGGKKLVVLKS